jgi:hypothetical protein
MILNESVFDPFSHVQLQRLNKKSENYYDEGRLSFSRLCNSIIVHHRFLANTLVL